MSAERLKKIFIVAGETSGDMHAAHLVEAIKAQEPNVHFWGLGGPQMKKSGVDINFDMTQLAVIGFWEVVEHYRKLKKIFNTTLEQIKHLKPDCVVLVDYPGFNLRLAKACKKIGIPVIYYICPKIWAWKKNRGYQIRDYVDKMLLIFEFEKAICRSFDINATFVGHPLIDQIKNLPSAESIRTSLGLIVNELTIGLLPGSRINEIKKHMPVMMESATLLKQKYPKIQFILIKAPGIDRTTIESFIPDQIQSLRIVESECHAALHACDGAIVKSGTISLETGMLELPMVVIYKTSLLTWLLYKLFVKIPHVALVNIIAKKEVVPEFIQYKATAQNIVKHLVNILENPERVKEMKRSLHQIKLDLGDGQASQRAAKEILTYIQKQN